jgi:nucleoside-diphosphate-sugar epimerase
VKVLVTGASGFIGSTLVPALAAANHEMRTAGMTGCDAVVHLANLAHARADPALLWKVNVEGTRRIAEEAAAAGVRRLIYLSSVKASGEQSGARPFDGTEEPRPQDDYGRAKLAAEAAIAEVAARSALETVVLRPPLVYGPGVKGNFLALMKAVARGWPLPLASIRNRRSLVYVGNLCDAVAACLESAGAAGKTFYVADGKALSTPALCRAIGDALGRPARLFHFPARLLPLDKLKGSLVVDDALLRDELGWKPPFSFQEGLSATAAWYRNRL